MIYYIPFIVQAVVILVDEFYFHWKRGLPKWERIGHPLDTLTIVATLAYTLIFPYSHTTLIPFIAIAALSAIFVTKDEFVHKEHCQASEQWLHAVLFLNHPLLLIATGWFWAQKATLFLTMQLCVAALFCLYQLIYWNLVWKK
ncbi:MAG: hypothetical protein H7A36_05025 [Chlamydiales bacterium]|nr:hypothetical protein [Chlamydiales bacterium]